MRNSFCGTPHIPFKVYFTIYIPACNINQMWQRSLTSPVKDARISWSSESRRGLEKKAKGTWSWSKGWGCSYNPRSVLNLISLVTRKWISVEMHRAWPVDTHGIHQGQQHCCPKPCAHGTAREPPGLSCSFSSTSSTTNHVLRSDSQQQQGWRDSADTDLLKQFGSSSKVPGFSLADRTLRKALSCFFSL